MVKSIKTNNKYISLSYSCKYLISTHNSIKCSKFTKHVLCISNISLPDNTLQKQAKLNYEHCWYIIIVNMVTRVIHHHWNREFRNLLVHNMNFFPLKMYLMLFLFIKFIIHRNTHLWTPSFITLEIITHVTLLYKHTREKSVNTYKFCRLVSCGNILFGKDCILFSLKCLQWNVRVK